MAAAGFVGGSVTVPDRLLSLKAGASWPELIRRARPVVGAVVVQVSRIPMFGFQDVSSCWDVL